MKFEGLEVKWLGHSSIFIKNSKVIYIDPYNIKEGSEKADLVFLTHSHYDHCSFADLSKIVKEGTRIFAPPDCQSTILKFNIPVKIEVVEPGAEIQIGDISILAFPAYNIDKSFHAKSEGWLGYLIKIKEFLIYHAGDTDLIPEMQKLTGYKQPGKNLIALLPIGGRFTMSVEEAVESAKLIKPFLAVPIHFGSVVGSLEDAKEFVELCKEEGIDAKMLED